MALAELSPGGLRRRFRRTPQPETPTLVSGVDLPVCPVSEGDDQTGGSDLALPTEPQPLHVRIIGSRNPFTGEIASYHQEVHGQTYPVMPLALNQEVVIQ